MALVIGETNSADLNQESMFAPNTLMDSLG